MRFNPNLQRNRSTGPSGGTRYSQLSRLIAYRLGLLHDLGKGGIPRCPRPCWAASPVRVERPHLCGRLHPVHLQYPLWATGPHGHVAPDNSLPQPSRQTTNTCADIYNGMSRLNCAPLPLIWIAADVMLTSAAHSLYLEGSVSRGA